MSSWVAAIDCGTSLVKAGVFDLKGKMKSYAAKQCPCIYARNGHIEQDPRHINRQAFACLAAAVRRSKVSPKKIAAVSLSSQRATVICIDQNRNSLGNAISWQDLRGAPQVETLRTKMPDQRYYGITGLPNNPVFSLAKILWIKKNMPALYKKSRRFVLIHDYLLYQLGCRDFFCDWSNASLTGMLDTAHFSWSREILKLSGIKGSKLPLLVPSGRRIGNVSSAAAKRCGLLAGTPIISGGGDQQCAGIGAGAVSPGTLEITLGSTAVSLSCTERFRKDPKMRVSCSAHAVPGKWVLEGLQNAGGASLGWFKKIAFDGRYFSESFFKKVAEIKPGSAGILFFPFLAGASAPSWNPDAKAVFLGLMHHHGRESMARAIMEGVAMEMRRVLDVFDLLKVPVREIRLTGGSSRIGVWNQIQSDIYGKKVSTLENPQASLLGAAILAAYGVGCFGSLERAAGEMIRIKKTYVPDERHARKYGEMYRKYCKIYQGFEKNGLFQEVSR